MTTRRHLLFPHLKCLDPPLHSQGQHDPLGTDRWDLTQPPAFRAEDVSVTLWHLVGPMARYFPCKYHQKKKKKRKERERRIYGQKGNSKANLEPTLAEGIVQSSFNVIKSNYFQRGCKYDGHLFGGGLWNVFLSQGKISTREENSVQNSKWKISTCRVTWV